MFIRIMSSVSTYRHSTRRIIAIDPYSPEWGCIVWGWTWRNRRCSLISFSTKVPNKCARTNYYFHKIFKITSKWQLQVLSAQRWSLVFDFSAFGQVCHILPFIGRVLCRVCWLYNISNICTYFITWRWVSCQILLTVWLWP